MNREKLGYGAVTTEAHPSCGELWRSFRAVLAGSLGARPLDVLIDPSLDEAALGRSMTLVEVTLSIRGAIPKEG